MLKWKLFKQRSVLHFNLVFKLLKESLCEWLSVGVRPRNVEPVEPSDPVELVDPKRGSSIDVRPPFVTIQYLR